MELKHGIWIEIIMIFSERLSRILETKMMPNGGGR